MIKSGITLDEVKEWGGEEVFNKGLHLVQAGDVLKVDYNDDELTVTGKVVFPSGSAPTITLKLEAGGRVRSNCPCRTNQDYGMICPHTTALGIAIATLEMDEPEAAPPPRTCGEAQPSPNEPSPDDTPPAERFIEVPMMPKFFAEVYGSRAALSIELDAWYGDIDFPACSLQAEHTVYLKDPDDDLVRRTRSLQAEKDAVKVLESWGFEPGYREGDMRFHLTAPQQVLNFLGGGIPDLRRKGWRVELSDRLLAVTETMPSVVPVVTVRDAPGGAFDVKYTFDAMGHDVSPVEIQAALNRGDGYIMSEGRVVLLDNSAINAMHDVFRDTCASQGGAPAGWFRVKGVHAPYVKASLDRLDCIDLDDSAAANWRETADARNNRDPNARYEPVAIGPLDSVLRPYQKQGVYWMRFLENAGLSGLLADEMGLGKTLQTLTWLSLARQPKAPSLIVCPTSLVMNWAAEAKRFTPNLKVLVVSGPDRAAVFARIPEADVVVTSYALLQRDFEAAYAGLTFSAMVIDEAQHIKNRQTKNAEAVKSVAARSRLALTGTPIENSVADVWSIFDFLMPGYLGDYEEFKFRYEDPILNGKAAETLERLKRKTHPFILRRVKKSVAKDLPDKIVKVSYCPMSDAAQRDYNAALEKARAQAGSLVAAKGFARSKFELLALLMKLRQIASRAKVEPFMEQLVSAIEGGHKILVFSQFVTMLKLIAEALQAADIPFCYLDGSTKDRLGECERFNHAPDIPVFLISLMAGGTGLNLTSADMVIHYDPWWNPAVEDQATDRAHRIGQKKTVYVLKMIASGSVEEKVLALQRRKQAIIAATVETSDAAVMEKLTAADLTELFG